MNRMVLLIIIILLSGFVVKMNAQSATFTEINPDGRNVAMGNAGYALNANAFSVFNNTAAIAFKDKTSQVGYSFTHYAPESKTYNGLHSVGGYYRINHKHSVAMGFRYLTYEKIAVWSDDENIAGTYTPYDWAIDIGYAFRISNAFSVSANMRYITSEIANSKYYAGYKTGNAFSGDISFMYNNHNLRTSLGVNNIGTKIKYGGDKNDLSSNVKIGVAYDWDVNPDNCITGVGQASYLLTADDNAQEFFGGIGAEYKYQKKYSVRTGYRIGDKAGSFASVGVGINIRAIAFDFAYLFGGNSVIVRNTMVFGLSASF